MHLLLVFCSFEFPLFLSGTSNNLLLLLNNIVQVVLWLDQEIEVDLRLFSLL